MATHNVCSFFKFGFCKHGDFCKNYHEKRICENEACNIPMCSLRHPRICRFFKEYKRCKFDPCAYKHEDSDIIIRHLKEENKAILVKLEKLSNDIELLNEKERDSEEMIERKGSCCLLGVFHVGVSFWNDYLQINHESGVFAISVYSQVSKK